MKNLSPEGPATYDKLEPDTSGGGPEPSLAARLARSAVPGMGVRHPKTEPVPDDQETGLAARMREGDESSPRGGRVDAAGATFGPDPERDRIAGVRGEGSDQMALTAGRRAEGSPQELDR